MKKYKTIRKEVHHNRRYSLMGVMFYITLRVIETHQNNCPEIVGHMKTELDALKAQKKLEPLSF